MGVGVCEGKKILKDFDVQININKNLSTYLVFVQYNKDNSNKII